MESTSRTSPHVLPRPTPERRRRFPRALVGPPPPSYYGFSDDLDDFPDVDDPPELADDPPYFDEPPSKKYGGTEYCIRAETTAHDVMDGSTRMRIQGWSTDLGIVDRVDQVCSMRKDKTWVCEPAEFYMIKMHPKCKQNLIEVQKLPPGPSGSE